MKLRFRNRPAKIENEDFFARVYDVVRLIPRGRVTTYGAIARFIGAPQSARMVGWALNASHGSAEKVPAHRVVNRSGMLSGKHHFDQPDRMQQLLENEGIRVTDNCIPDFEKLFWDPYKELF